MTPSTNVIIYVCFLKILGCALFLIGFFPIKAAVKTVSTYDNFPTSVGDHRLSYKDLYRRRYSKVVVVVIDALRLDFITEGDNMPFVQELLRGGQSCVLSTKVEVPTVTLPRIKTIVTGSASTFLDIVSNLGMSDVMSDDNIIDQASRHGFEVVFYGDDTWMRLYPKAFKRFEGVSSFYVNDFYEVDNAVTRNLREELARSDWDVMILHYLGLDHIGHVEGPFSSLVPAKLLEIDGIVREIYQYLDKLKQEGHGDVLILLTGDHGMKNSGGHGGASLEEITVPAVFINNNCSSDYKSHALQQTDFSSILSAHLGLPVPAGSSGRVVPTWFGGLNPNESLYATYYNAHRMTNTFSTIVTKDIKDEFDNGILHYGLWIQEGSFLHWDQAVKYFSLVQNKIVSNLAQSRTTHSSYLLISITLLIQALILLFANQSASPTWPILSALAAFNCLALWISGLFGVAVVFVVFNLQILTKSNVQFFKRVDYFFCTLIILHPISFLSTSFIEEEHQFWYFTFATLLVYLVYCNVQQVATLFPLLILHRFLKMMNQTGDKWAHLPDLGDWLLLPENAGYLAAFYCVGSILSWYANLKCGWQNSVVSLDGAFALTQGVLSYLYNVATEKTVIFCQYPKSSGISEVRCFWMVSLIRTFIALAQSQSSDRTSSAKSSSIKVLSVLIQLHLSIVSLLLKPYNVIFGPAMVLFSAVFSSRVKELWQLVVLHYWLGMTFYFYMGNSNSIANIDVTVSIIGLEEFNILLALVFMVLHTYAFPILAYLLLTKEILKRRSRADQEDDCCHRSTYLLLNGSSLLFFTILILVQREHLFIWSVFSPKLLYLMCQTVLVVVMIISSSLLDLRSNKS